MGAEYGPIGAEYEDLAGAALGDSTGEEYAREGSKGDWEGFKPQEGRPGEDLPGMVPGTTSMLNRFHRNLLEAWTTRFRNEMADKENQWWLARLNKRKLCVAEPPTLDEDSKLPSMAQLLPKA